MKLRLHIDEFEMNGYDNIRLTTETAKNVDKLEVAIDFGEAEEVIAENVVDYLPIAKVENTVQLWSRWLKKQGRLIITGMDLQEISKAVASYAVNVPDANEMLYGGLDEPKRVCFSIGHLCTFLKERCGMKILKKRVNGYTYMVEAQRQ